MLQLLLLPVLVQVSTGLPVMAAVIDFAVHGR
jgi:hypothetical protein